MSRAGEAEDSLRIRAAQKLSLERLGGKVGCQTDIIVLAGSSLGEPVRLVSLSGISEVREAEGRNRPADPLHNAHDRMIQPPQPRDV